MSVRQPDKSRAVAAGIIARWLKTGDFPDRLLDRVIADRAFVMEMVYGIARRHRSLEWVISRLADRGAATAARPYLLVGLYQLLMMDNVAPYAAVNETVKAVPRRAAHAAGFVNALLRRAARDRNAILTALTAEPLAIRESHPDLLVDRWTARFGAERTASLCRWNNERPEVTININTLRTDMGRITGLFASAGISVRPHPFAPDTCLALPHGLHPDSLPGFREGLFSVQDPSTLAAVRLLDPQPGDRILDACAAPGGKTALIAGALRENGALIAMDLHADRMPRLRENIERLSLANVTVVRGDAAGTGIAEAAGNRPFDRILLDVPCTNTGVLRRRPDARWRFSPDRLTTLPELQRRMLNNAAEHLAPGGTLVYSTCSLEPEEGEALIASWLTTHATFEQTATTSLFPPETQTDGIYAAALSNSHYGATHAVARASCPYISG